MSKKVLFMIAFQDFRDEEYFEPKAVLEHFEFEVDTCSSKTGTAIGTLEGKTNVNLLIKDVNVDEYDAVAFIGGAGIKNYWNDDEAMELAKAFFNKKKLLAAICSAPVILLNAGLLKNVKATSFSGDGDQLTQNGAIYTGASVEFDNNILTADGPNSAKAFGEEIVKLLK